MKKNINEINHIKNYISIKQNEYFTAYNNDVDKKLEEFKINIENKKYKGIVIYPVAVNWYPIQRPHHFLRVMGENGYLCFFCEELHNEKFKIEEKYKNVFLINDQTKLIPLIKNRRVIILITYFLQYIYAKFFPNSTLWFDVLDRLDFMSYYNEYSKKIYGELVKNADIVTYSARNLKKYVKSRSDAYLCPNAVNAMDFLQDKTEVKMPKDLEESIAKDKPIIGYYGAIEYWFDFDLIKKIDESNKYNIVIIGKINEDLLDNIEDYEFQNVKFLGPKKYLNLKKYGCFFDVAMIPFKISKLTNSVSPVKFFEYMAMHIPVISTNIYEMRKYRCDIVKIVNAKNVIEKIDSLLTDYNRYEIIRQCDDIVSKNTWQKRMENIMEKF